MGIFQLALTDRSVAVATQCDSHFFGWRRLLQSSEQLLLKYHGLAAQLAKQCKPGGAAREADGVLSGESFIPANLGQSTDCCPNAASHEPAAHLVLGRGGNMPFRRRRERGSLFVGVMLMIIPVCGLLGLVADLGLSYFTMQSAHAAAEAAAIAAVRSAMDNVNAGGSYSCGSNNFLKCQAATNCATVIPSPTNSNLQNGCAYAIANGFSSGGLSGKQTVTIEANTTSPVLGVKVNYWVTVRITQQNPLTFLAVLGGNKLNVGVESTAAVVFKVPPSCITSLDSSASSAFTVSGGASVVLSNCAAQVNSNDGSALNCNGGGSLSAPSINVVGGAGGCSATTGAPAVSDPFGGLAPPDLTGLANGSFDNGTNTYSPGIYKGGISVHNASVTFSPGTYILEGGGLTCN